MARTSPMYLDLKEEASPSSLLLFEFEDVTHDQERLVGTKPKWTTTRWIAVLIASVLFTNIASILVTSKAAAPCHRHKSVFEPPKGIPPFFRNISLELKPEWIFAPFYDTADSIYRKHDSPETEAAWQELTQLDAGFMLLPKEQAEQAEIDPKRHAYWDNAEKGLVGYPVRLEATHQLHCLNLLRRYSHFNYNYTLEIDKEQLKTVPDYNRRLHVDHCVDYLRRRLMCTSDMGLLPYIWFGDEGGLVGDKSRMYTCRNYESVRRFVKKNGEPADGRAKPKPGDYILYGYI